MNYQHIFSVRFVFLLLFLLVMGRQTQAEVLVQLDTPKNEINALKAKMDPLIQGYFKAVASGDIEAALGAYDWYPVSTGDMAEAREAAVETMALLKQQIDANGGLQKVELVGIFQQEGYMNDNKKLILEIGFSNGFKDISAGIKLTARNNDWKLNIKDVTGTMAEYPGLAVAGLRSAMKTAEAYYAAVLANDYEAINKLTYSAHKMETQSGKATNLVKAQINAKMASLNTLIKANGGLKSLEVREIGLSKGQLGTQHKKYQSNDYKRLAEMVIRFDVNYGNGKTDYRKNAHFILDNGQWKVELGSI